MEKRGFTLIELLVVISIIGLLAAIVLAALGSVRVQTRDKQRAVALEQIRNAVETYNIDIGHYPNSNGTWTSFDSPAYSPNPIVTPNAANLSAALSKYFPTFPVDPKNLGADSGYLYIGDNNNYCILIWKTPENMNNFPKSEWPPARCTSSDSSGQCVGGTNSIYIGVGGYAGGC